MGQRAEDAEVAYVPLTVSGRKRKNFYNVELADFLGNAKYSALTRAGRAESA